MDVQYNTTDIQNNVTIGTLVTASCLKSRWSWLYGQLWLFPNGLLRLPSPWWTGLARGYSSRPTIDRDRLENRIFDEQFFLQETINPKNIWGPQRTDCEGLFPRRPLGRTTAYGTDQRGRSKPILAAYR